MESKGPTEAGEKEHWQVPRHRGGQHETHHSKAPFDDGGRPKDKTLKPQACEDPPTPRKNGAYAEQSSLTALVKHLGRDVKAWLECALKPLPETFRISLHRNDRQWTVDQVKALGAKPIP